MEFMTIVLSLDTIVLNSLNSLNSMNSLNN